MEDSPNSSPTFSPPPRKRKLTPRSRSSGSSESDDSYRSEVKYGKRGGNHVSKWNNGILESYGIFYDEKATELSELTKSVLECMYSVEFYGIKDRAAFWTKLLEIKECLMESTKKCMSSFDEDSAVSCKIEEIENCLMQARKNVKEEFISMRIGSASSDFLSRHLFTIWYAGITEFVQYYSDLIKELIFGKRIGVKGAFSQLLILFSKIFLLNPVRGDAWQKVQMRINGVDTASVPDIRYTLLGEPTSFSTGSTLMTGTVGEEKMGQFSNMENTTDFNIRDLTFRSQSVGNLLGQHGGELLMEIMNSAIPNTSFGIICAQTTIIFTRLDMSAEHFQKLKNADELEGDRSRILYSRPYNFLVRKDREEILDTMFQLGLLCRARSLFYQD